MKKLLFISLIIFVLITSMNAEEPLTIPEESIRFRIIANSNETADQAMKMNIKKDLENNLFEKVSKSTSIEETRKIIKENEKEIQETLNEYDIQYNISYGDNYFPLKEYKGVKYQEGSYESLVISLGAAEGENWWCVLYPPLCMLDSESNNYSEVEYKFYIEEVLNKLTT